MHALYLIIIYIYIYIYIFNTVFFLEYSITVTTENIYICTGRKRRCLLYFRKSYVYFSTVSGYYDQLSPQRLCGNSCTWAHDVRFICLRLYIFY